MSTLPSCTKTRAKSRTKARKKVRIKAIVAMVLTSSLFLTACTVTGMAGGMTGN